MAPRHSVTTECQRSPPKLPVWDAVAVYVQEQLLLRKGVRIPTFGSFSIVSERIEAEDGAMTLQWPAFCLARNLAGIHNLMESYPPGHKEVQPLKYTEVAAAASVTWQTGKACIFGTTSLVSHCLRKGENIAFVLKDIGVLLIEGTRVQMKFYYDFLERISGKENLEKVVFKVPRLQGHGGVPGGSCSLPDVLWPSHRLSQVSTGVCTQTTTQDSPQGLPCPIATS
ncbi:coiled-coil domain-containing protein 81-like isoform X1 [Gallus gallus]|uniref:coiled-coil domain-containing protein 81-like isoform X1 n=1 Tax=Gallus gallus TaxID=9031 RepID=UPI001AE65E96|nr:coiled-coil domain-containing protein 81-like isoform X1 [Gallus gallus]